MPLARRIIEAQPGLTAQGIVSLALQRSELEGFPLSAAANPESSLTATLHKCHEDFYIERKRERDGRYRFYPEGVRVPLPPTDFGAPSEPSRPVGPEFVEPRIDYPGELKSTKTLPGNHLESIPATVSAQTPTEGDRSGNGECCIELPAHQASKIRALVDLGLYPSEHDAHGDLVKKGLESILAKLSI